MNALNLGLKYRHDLRDELRWMRGWKGVTESPQAFVRSCPLKKKDAGMGSAQLYENYQSWCRDHHLQPFASKEFNQIVKTELEINLGLKYRHDLQAEIRWMTGLCRQCNVRDIDTLIAIVSVIRPGAANQGKKLAFTRRYQGLEPITYPHPSLEPVLNDTFGLVVYEEHILQICEAFAGLDPGRADVLRRALNKQKRNVIEEIRKEFFAASMTRGHAPEKIEEVWGLVTGFAGYAFCKAHSTAYGVEAYQSAWLKRNYPAEFMAAVLTNGKGFYDPLVYVLESYRLGLKFLPPTVNEPGPMFGVHGDAIRVPLTRTKGLSDRIIKRLLVEREREVFASLADFHQRVKPSPEEMEAMIRAGGFDEFGEPRTRQFWQAQQLQKSESRNQKSEIRNLEFDFEAGTNPVAEFLAENPALLREPTRRERLEAETELFGYAVSGHPLELFAEIAWDTYCPVSRLGEHIGETVVACGLVIEQRTHHQITGEPMKFLMLADWTGIVETELFAQTYKNYGLATVRYPVLEVTAMVEPFENGRGFSLRVLRAGKPRHTELADSHSTVSPGGDRLRLSRVERGGRGRMKTLLA